VTSPRGIKKRHSCKVLESEGLEIKVIKESKSYSGLNQRKLFDAEMPSPIAYREGTPDPKKDDSAVM